MPADGFTGEYGSQSMIAPLRRVLVRLPGDEIDAEAYQAYGLSPPPERELAFREQSAFVRMLEQRGAQVSRLDEAASLQACATYDPALVTDEGAVVLESGRAERRGETFPMARALLRESIPIIGWIKYPGCMDGGDTIWLDRETLLVARGYRSNDAGYQSLRRALDGVVNNWHRFELPHWHGPNEVLHLMSVVSLVDEDLAVIYPPAMPIGLLGLLREREYRLVEVPDEEYATQGCNVLALEPGVALACAGNHRTVAGLREQGAKVLEYEGEHVSIRRISGPTCNTRPLLRRE